MLSLTPATWRVLRCSYAGIVTESAHPSERAAKRRARKHRRDLARSKTPDASFTWRVVYFPGKLVEVPPCLK